jgi:hypothetical protein
MNGYAVLTNRKRSLIALVHSVFFLGLAVAGLFGWGTVTPLLASPAGKALAVSAVYLLVTIILLWLACIARSRHERLYFLLCASSAGIGLARAVAGDTALHAGACLRVLLLACAVVICTIIWRNH